MAGRALTLWRGWLPPPSHQRTDDRSSLLMVQIKTPRTTWVGRAF